jgi:hypothetical protein
MTSRRNQSTGESTPRAVRSANPTRTKRTSASSHSKLQGLSLSEDDPSTASTPGQTVHTEQEHHTLTPSERGQKGIPHGMSPHDRGVLGAQARWAKVHASQEAQREMPEKGKGG